MGRIVDDIFEMYGCGRMLSCADQLGHCEGRENLAFALAFYIQHLLFQNIKVP